LYDCAPTTACVFLKRPHHLPRLANKKAIVMSTQPTTSWKTYFVAAAVSAVVGFLAIYLIAGQDGNGAGPSATTQADQGGGETGAQAGGGQTAGKLNVGKMATFVFRDAPTDLPEAKFNDASGKAITLADFRGKVVLLNLWATWCAPCRKEMPDLDALQMELGSDRFEVVAVSVDRGSPEKSRKFLDEIKSKALKLYHDPSAQLGFTLKTIGMPSTLLIDPEGRELGRLVGPAEWASEDAKRLIRAHVAKAAS
jgi:thiol-disulfide isomerase/thioredoxin